MYCKHQILFAIKSSKKFESILIFNKFLGTGYSMSNEFILYALKNDSVHHMIVVSAACAIFPGK